MSGKPYTMKEMKCIVDYLTEQKAYSEIKARKMWMNFANTKLTNRTWQSLKETFLKRILPDIHNPYYKLNMDQIRSFRQGCDVVAKEKNKLIIKTESDDSNSNAESDKVEPSTSINNKEADELPGETIKSCQITSRHSSSADTLILDKCYETADDIRKDLESPRADGDIRDMIVHQNNAVETVTDYINKMEPLPLSLTMQKLLDDFASEPETEVVVACEIQEDASETCMQVIEVANEGDDEPMILDSEVIVTENIPTNSDDQPNDVKDDKNKTSSQSLLQESEIVAAESDIVVIEESCVQVVLDSDTIGNNTEPNDETEVTNSNGISKPENTEPLGQNCSNNTTDASLPNNPEGLNKAAKLNTLEKPETSPHKTNGKKRSNSRNIFNVKLKKKKQATETETVQANAIEDKTTKDTETVIVIDDDKKGGEEETSTKSHNDTEISKDMSTNASADLEPDDQVENPCLKSVSLYEEQFNKTKYTDSESSGNESATKNITTQCTKNVADRKVDRNFPEEVLMLKSHSEPGSDQDTKIKNTAVVSTKIQRDKALANIFGFTHGVSSSRKRRSSYRRSSKHKLARDNMSTPSSDWTSQSDSEMFVSPPRGKKSRHSKKYLKPQSARVLALEEEGGLFVMHGKKIFPLIKDGKTVKNYLRYLPDSESEDNESYWKQKYFEEKNKADELKKLLEQQSKEAKARDTSPILRSNAFRNSTSRAKARPSVQSVTRDQDNEVLVLDHDDNKVDEKKREKQEKVKIKFTRNNEEVHLEGHWQQIHPVLEQVVQIFNKESDGDKHKPAIKVPAKNDSNSGFSTPIIIHQADPEVKEKIDQLEKQIFEEIEALDKEEQSKEEIQPQMNVTKRKRGRPRTLPSTPLLQAPAKKLRKSKSSDKNILTVTETQQDTYKLNKEPKVGVETKVDPDKSLNEELVKLPGKTKQVQSISNGKSDPPEDVNVSTSSTSTRNSKSIDKSEVLNTSTGIAEKAVEKNISTSTSNNNSLKNKTSNARKNTKDATATAKNTSKANSPVQTRRSTTRKSDSKSEEGTPPTKKVTRASVKSENSHKESISTRTRKIATRSIEVMPITSPPDFSMNSIDSTQGYQDSDISPTNVFQRKKKKLNLSGSLYKGRRSTKRKTFSVPDVSTDSSNSSFNVPLPKNVGENSSTNTEVYRTDSYQLLLPKPLNSYRKLAKIDEACLVPSVMEPESNDNSNDKSSNKLNSDGMDSNHDQLEVGSSSNVSLPVSPELSIVGRLSVTRDNIDSIEEPTLNEIHTNLITDSGHFDNYLISAVDISVPLMEQECDFEHTDTKRSKQISAPKTSVSESLLNKVCSVNIKDNSTMLSSLDQRLQALLLESAKKISSENQALCFGNDMDVDESNTEVVKKSAKKRCSTPRKRKGTQKSKKPKVETVVEEEHTVSCLHSGRQSCPPVLNILPNGMEEANSDRTRVDNVPMNETTTKRQKKDIIRVKIVRPKDKKNDNSTKNATRMSVNTDSGINDVELGISFTDTNDSVEFIHNHSETCLQANECIGNSVEFIETTSKSVISINSISLMSGDTQNNIEGVEVVTPELFCNNAQDVASFQGIKSSNFQTSKSNSPSSTVYHSPLNTSLTCHNDSVLTEDLSDEIPCLEQRPNKWYLFSEDETTHTNIGAGSNVPNSHVTGVGSNLKQLFPIMCAVPDLSTITEISRENDDSRKPTLDGDNIDDMDSHGLFN